MDDLRCPIEAGAETHPDLPAVLGGGRVYTFLAYHEAVNRTAAALREWGSARGDMLAIALEPSAEYLFLLAALFRNGAVACPINPRWPLKRIVSRLERLGCGKLVCSERKDTERITTLALDALRDAPSDAAPPQHAITKDQPATILFTSGSSGHPKATLISYGNHYANAVASNRNIEVGPGDRWLLSLPLHHAAGIGVVFRCMIGGGAVAVPEPREPIEEALGRYGITHVSLVSTQLQRLLRKKEAVQALAGLKAILLGGSAISASLIRRAVACGLPIHTSYGMTETATQVTTTRKGDPLEVLLTSGRPLEPGTVRIATDGEILVRGETLFPGYVRDTGIERPDTEGGWFPTGDLGHIDDAGCLVVTGRKDNRFVSGGENIQPEEIERCLCRMDVVSEAVIVPVEDTEFGHIAVAFVAGESGAPLDPVAFAAQLAQELPRYMIPKHFFPWPTILEHSASKIDRTTLAAMAHRLLAKIPAPRE